MLKPRAAGIGFSLIELLITLAISAILLTVALPSYQRYVLRSHRGDAHRALADIQHAQERWRAENTSYAADLVNDLQLSNVTPSGLYLIQITQADAHGYIASATAQNRQADDTDCRSLSLTLQGDAQFSYGHPNGQTINTTQGNPCWQ